MNLKRRYSFINELVVQRIYDLYLLMRKSGQYNSLVDISRAIEISPMPIHYISYLMGSRVYSRYFIEGRKVEYRFIYKNILYNSFLSRCRELRQQGLTDANTIISKALLSPAPCIGLSESRIRRILRSKGAK